MLYKKHKKIIITTFLIILIISSVHLTLFSDEAFSLGLIKFNAHKLIYFDSLDVHPPLYYFLLKLFLSITTFYTNNFYMKILFARLFSCILSLLTFYTLYKINIILNIKIKLWHQIFIFILLGFLPFVFIPISNFFIIRMYPLAALLVSIEFYDILRYKYINSNNLVLVEILIVTVCSFYTHYISALISGLMLMVIIIYYMFKSVKSCIKYIIIMLLSIIFYIPWLFIAFKQISQVSNGNWWMDNKYFFINIILILILFIIFTYPFIKYVNIINNKCKFGVAILFTTFFLLLVIVFIISLLRHPMFQAKYAYPILLLYSFISVCMYIKLSNRKRLRFYSIILACLLLFGNSYNIVSQIRLYDLPTINVLKETSYDKLHKKIYLNKHLSPSEYITNVMYCKYHNITIVNYNREVLSKNAKLRMLYKNVFFLINKNNK